MSSTAHLLSAETLDDMMATESSCAICGKPAADNERLCLDCQIEKHISECTRQTEM